MKGMQVLYSNILEIPISDSVEYSILKFPYLKSVNRITSSNKVDVV